MPTLRQTIISRSTPWHAGQNNEVQIETTMFRQQRWHSGWNDKIQMNMDDSGAKTMFGTTLWCSGWDDNGQVELTTFKSKWWHSGRRHRQLHTVLLKNRHSESDVRWPQGNDASFRPLGGALSGIRSQKDFWESAHSEETFGSETETLVDSFLGLFRTKRSGSSYSH